MFRISPDGIYTNLYSFCSVTDQSYNCLDGSGPHAGPVQGIDGNFYGTTAGGGASGDGTVFKLTVPLHPPANQISAIQLSGADLVVNLPSIAGETYQLQFASNLSSGNWSNIVGASVTNSIGALMTLTNSGGALQPQGFYRFVIMP